MTYKIMETLNRQTTPIRMRNYGRIIQDMIYVASHEQDRDAREMMTIYIGLCMKQKNIIWNKEQDTSIQRIKDDIATISKGALSTDFPEFEETINRKKGKR